MPDSFKSNIVIFIKGFIYLFELISCPGFSSFTERCSQENSDIISLIWSAGRDRRVQVKPICLSKFQRTLKEPSPEPTLLNRKQGRIWVGEERRH